MPCIFSSKEERLRMRHRRIMIAGLLALWGCLGIGQAMADPRAKQGLDIAPVPLDLHGRNKNLVGLGSYLVNAVGGCNDCHTWNPNIPPAGSSYAQGHDPFSGQPKKTARFQRRWVLILSPRRKILFTCSNRVGRRIWICLITSRS